MTIVDIPTVTADKTDESNFNNIQSGVTGDIYPRVAGLATDKGADLGSETYKWLGAEIISGYLTAGIMIPWYDYAGLLSVPQGWMLCDGSQVTKSAYDSQHASGDWDLYVSSSQFEELYLPNMNAVYLKGTTGATQSGSAPITTAGNSGHVINLSHDHGGSVNLGSLNADRSVTDGSDQSYIDAGAGGAHTHTATINPDLTSNISIKPQSQKAKFLIRIVS